MEKQVILTVKTQQIYDNPAKPEVTELVSEGVMTQEDGALVLTYQETELTGLEGTTTTFRILPGCVTLVRSGTLNNEMVFEYGRLHLSMYATPYGTMSIGVNTRRMAVDLGEDGGEVEIHYCLEVDHAVMSENQFHISVRPKLAQ